VKPNPAGIRNLEEPASFRGFLRTHADIAAENGELKGISINHKAVLRLMNKMGIRSIARKRKVYKKLDEIESIHSYPNILNREFTATRPNQKWVTDVTYIHTQQANQIIDDYISFFNYERIQLKSKQTPYQVRCLSD
jgi:hypothetical protein